MDKIELPVPLQLVFDAVKGVDQRLERFEDKHDEQMAALNLKLDTLNENTVKKPDCAECKQGWISKRPFYIAGGTVVAIISALTLVNIWLSVYAGIAKAMAGP